MIGGLVRAAANANVCGEHHGADRRPTADGITSSRKASPASQGHKRPYRFDHSERPRALQEAIDRTERTRRSERQHEPMAAILQGVADKHRGHGEQAEGGPKHPWTIVSAPLHHVIASHHHVERTTIAPAARPLEGRTTRRQRRATGTSVQAATPAPQPAGLAGSWAMGQAPEEPSGAALWSDQLLHGISRKWMSVLAMVP